MTLKLRLVMDGDATGAAAATKKTKKEITDLKKETARASGKIVQLGNAGRRSFGGIARSSKQAAGGISRINRQVDLGRAKFTRFSAAAKGALFGLVASVAGGALAFNSVTGAAFEFRDALAEVSTLVDTATFDMKGLEAAAIEQSKVFGGTATSQAQAFYQIISGGAESAHEANLLLTASNKLAIGGITSVTIAAGGLTALLNAYGKGVEEAGAVSDTLFIGMREGITTVGELAGGLGVLAPLAFQAGISIEEIVASTSALTKGGIKTVVAINGLRAVVASIIKPTSEAADMAKSLGLEFDALALKRKGLQKFLEDVVDKTGGSTAALAQLFGGVEALGPVLALAGNAGKDFSDIMEQMDEKLGATAKSFTKVAKNAPSFESGRVWANLKGEILKTSGALAQDLVPVMKIVADNMEGIVLGATAAAGAILAMAAPAILSGLASLTVAAGALLISLGPIPIALGVIAAAYVLLQKNQSAAAKAAGVADGNWQRNKRALNNAADAADGYSKSLLNLIAAQASTVSIELDNAIDVGVAARNSERSFVDSFGFSTLFHKNSIKSAEDDVLRLQRSALDLNKQWNIVRNNLEKPIKKKKNTGSGVPTIPGEKSDAQRVIDSLRFETEQLGRVNVQQEISNALRTAGVSAASAQGKIISGLVVTYDSAQKAQEKYNDTVDFARDTFRGFISDMQSSLKSGVSFWKSLSDAALGSLERISNKLIDMATDNLFESAFGGGQTGGSGGFGLGAIASQFGITGNSLPIGFGGLFAEGGRPPVGKISVVGEKGKELFIPDQAGTIIPNNKIFGLAAGSVANNNIPQASRQPQQLVQIITPPGATVREEKGRSGNTDIRKFIISEVNKAAVDGHLNKSFGAAFGLKAPGVRR